MFERLGDSFIDKKTLSPRIIKRGEIAYIYIYIYIYILTFQRTALSVFTKFGVTYILGTRKRSR